MEPVLSIRDLKTHFYTQEGVVRAVDGLSYDLMPGKTLGIVGESGCGKSVHALSILRLIPSPPGKIVGGEILFKTKETSKDKGKVVDLTKISNRQMRSIRGAQIAMIFQEPMTSLNPVLTVGEQIAEAIRYHENASSATAWEKAADLLAQVGIPNSAKRVYDYPHAFSGGMRQRAMIAMALAMKPSILIADEPTTALDVTIQAQILEVIHKMQQIYNMAVILITHNMGVVAEICDDVIVMYAGKPAEKALTKEIFDHPSHPYTLGLLNSIPKLNHHQHRLVPIEGHPPNLADNIQGCSFEPRCPFAWDLCKSDAPPLLNARHSHQASCWHHDAEKNKTAPQPIQQKAKALRDREGII